MSQQNVAVARRWVELFNERGDVDEFLSLHDPEVELQTPGGPRLHGHDQVRDWFDAGFENVQSRIIPERFVAEGDIVVGLGRIDVRWIESGEVAHDGESAGAFWFRDGKIIAWQPFETHAAALKETGLEGRVEGTRDKPLRRGDGVGARGSRGPAAQGDARRRSRTNGDGHASARRWLHTPLPLTA